MGFFLATTAIRSENIEKITSDIISYAEEHGVSTQPSNFNYIQDQTDAIIYNPVKNWTVLSWPNLFNSHDTPLAKHLAKKNNWLISTTSVFDSKVWCHKCFQGSKEIHSFCSNPDYFKDKKNKKFWKDTSSPTTLSKTFNVPTETLLPYLVNTETLEAETKAHPNDEFPLNDIWCFTDFWKHLNITYPDPVDHNINQCLRLPNFKNKLPQCP